MATSETTVANRALSAIGTRSTIASLEEDSPEARECSLVLVPCRDELIRMAPWNCATNFNSLSVICSAPGTPENPSTGQAVWTKGIPPPPWAYEYAYPSDCLRPLWIVPQFATGFSGGVPITTAVTGGAPQFWQGPPVKFKVAIDQIGANGLPSANGSDRRVILTNQQQAILCYLKRVTNPDIMDDMFVQAWVAYMAARLAIALTGSKELANDKVKEANGFIALARQADGNEGLTINDVTPDWIRIRGTNFNSGVNYWGPNAQFDWGGLLSTY